MRWLAAVVVFVALTDVVAADDQLARAYFLTAQDYYRKGRIGEALQQFEEAYRVSKRPAFHYNIAICLERMGRNDEAIAAYQRYLSEEPNPSDARAVGERVEALRARAKRPATAPPAAAPPPATPPPAAPPAAAPPASLPAVVTPAPVTPQPVAAPARTPIYKRWWLWTAVGAAAVVLAVGIGVGAAVTPNDAAIPSNAYTIRFH